LRAKAKKGFAEREGVNLTYLPFIARAVIDALKAHPNINASYNEERALITLAGERFTLFVNENGFTVPRGYLQDDFIYFSGSGCTGNAYLYSHPVYTADLALVTYSTYFNGYAVFPDRSQPLTGLTTQLQSYSIPEGGSRTCSESTSVWGSDSLRPVKTVGVSGFRRRLPCPGSRCPKRGAESTQTASMGRRLLAAQQRARSGRQFPRHRPLSRPSTRVRREGPSYGRVGPDDRPGRRQISVPFDPRPLT
jgi:hypothetical protein